MEILSKPGGAVYFFSMTIRIAYFPPKIKYLPGQL